MSNNREIIGGKSQGRHSMKTMEKHYRVIIRVEGIDVDSGEAVGMIVQWRSDKLVRFPGSRLPSPEPSQPMPWRFIGEAKIGVETMEDLDVKIIELAPDPDSDEGLA